MDSKISAFTTSPQTLAATLLEKEKECPSTQFDVAEFLLLWVLSLIIISRLQNNLLQAVVLFPSWEGAGVSTSKIFNLSENYSWAI